MVTRSCTLPVGPRKEIRISSKLVFETSLKRGYVQPLPYEGPNVTTLHSSVNSTHWKTIYRCQNCTTWGSGGFATDGTPVFAWVISLTAVFDPSDVDTDFNEHDDCKRFHLEALEVNMSLIVHI